jgi:hypothetical protein
MTGLPPDITFFMCSVEPADGFYVELRRESVAAHPRFRQNTLNTGRTQAVEGRQQELA